MTAADATPPTVSGQRALVYGDVNLNTIDGSAVWAASVSEVLARAGCDVTLVLKARVTTDRLLKPIEALPNVRILRPFEEGLVDDVAGDLLSPNRATKLILSLDRGQKFDLVVLRGSRLLDKVAENGGFDGRVWAYLTDIPQTVTALTDENVDQLTRIVASSRLMLCQTEEIRSFIESTIPGSVGRCVLLPPVLPTSTEVTAARTSPGRPLKLAYAGKFAPRWKTEAMTRLPALLAERGVPAELHAIGDKIHDDPHDPTFADRMVAALRGSPGVTWHGGAPRDEALAIVAACDIGLSWRDRALDASLELSTKVLEYGAVGLPVALDRTPMHEALLGVDYPLFVDGDDVVDVLTRATDADVYGQAAAQARAAAEAYTMDRAVDRARAMLAVVFPTAPAFAGRTRALRVGVASHDLKFFTRLLERLSAMPELEVRVDRWASLERHDQDVSRALVDWADVIICEWCGPNAVWYSVNKRPSQRLIVRLHRFELYRNWPAQLDIAQVDRVICVSSHYASLVCERLGWPEDKVAVIPNWVDDRQLDRPKLPEARFHLGMIGVGESRKRFDLALDILETVRRQDDRFMLFAKTKMPWEYPWIWSRPGEPEQADAILRRVQNSPRLREAVVFDEFGPDVPTWLRRIGFILSTSDDESFHLAPAEGMASRAVPVIRAWPGAESIYDERWIRRDATEMAVAILDLADGPSWAAAGEEARDQVLGSFSLDRVIIDWTTLLAQDGAD